jgi:nucleoside-diphosphate-sugar epimerase
MSRPLVLVLGANGRFGAAAVHAFSGAGWQVLAQMRRAPVAPLPAGATVLTTPLHDTAALAAAAADARAVVHAVSPPYTRWDAELLPLARQGMAVAETLRARFMLPGNVYHYGQTMPALLSEDTPVHPSTAKGRQRLELEAEMQARAAQGRMQAVVVRAGDFYGGGRGSWLDLVIVKSLAQGKLVYPGPLDLPHAWAYLPDLARAFVALADRPSAPAFESLHFAGHALSGRELLAAIARVADALGWSAPAGWRQGGMPWGLIRAGGLVFPMWRELDRMSYLWRVPHALDGRALARAVGPLPTTPIEAALAAALRALGLAAPRRTVPAVVR